ncbi:hypothetical protein PR048_020657 [Dryococelus australis]|uniref:Uncharacterized protein n=1 Tax=Dryococelus australis TaxID=614101 RepID=A0ABQ9H6X0_9NEOP|nr:hypothetical protein PR048_020657 [Dryococelus australis]
MDRRQTARTGETGDPRENAPTSGITRHDFPNGKSGRLFLSKHTLLLSIKCAPAVGQEINAYLTAQEYAGVISPAMQRALFRLRSIEEVLDRVLQQQCYRSVEEVLDSVLQQQCYRSVEEVLEHVLQQQCYRSVEEVLDSVLQQQCYRSVEEVLEHVLQQQCYRSVEEVLDRVLQQQCYRSVEEVLEHVLQQQCYRSVEEVLDSVLQQQCNRSIEEVLDRVLQQQCNRSIEEVLDRVLQQQCNRSIEEVLDRVLQQQCYRSVEEVLDRVLQQQCYRSVEEVLEHVLQQQCYRSVEEVLDRVLQQQCYRSVEEVLDRVLQQQCYRSVEEVLEHVLQQQCYRSVEEVLDHFLHQQCYRSVEEVLDRVLQQHCCINIKLVLERVLQQQCYRSVEEVLEHVLQQQCYRSVEEVLDRVLQQQCYRSVEEVLDRVLQQQCYRSVEEVLEHVLQQQCYRSVEEVLDHFLHQQCYRSVEEVLDRVLQQHCCINIKLVLERVLQQQCYRSVEEVLDRVLQQQCYNSNHSSGSWCTSKRFYSSLLSREPCHPLRARENNASQLSALPTLRQAPTPPSRDKGAAVVECLVRSLPTKANRVQSSPGHSWIYSCGNRAVRCRCSAGFLGDFLLTLPFPSATAPYSSQSLSSALRTSLFSGQTRPYAKGPPFPNLHTRNSIFVPCDSCVFPKNPCPEMYRIRATAISSQVYHSSTSAEGKSNVSDVPVLVCNRKPTFSRTTGVRTDKYTTLCAGLAFQYVDGGRCSVAARALTSYKGQPGSISGAGRRVYSWISCFPPSLQSGAAPYPSRFHRHRGEGNARIRAAVLPNARQFSYTRENSVFVYDAGLNTGTYTLLYENFPDRLTLAVARTVLQSGGNPVSLTKLLNALPVCLPTKRNQTPADEDGIPPIQLETAFSQTAAILKHTKSDARQTTIGSCIQLCYRLIINKMIVTSESVIGTAALREHCISLQSPARSGDGALVVRASVAMIAPMLLRQTRRKTMQYSLEEKKGSQVKRRGIDET